MKHTIKVLSLLTLLFVSPLSSLAQNYVGVSFGYANQQVRQHNNGDVNTFWNGIWVRENDNHLHGVHLGMPFFHHLGYGFELDWGLNFGFYYTSNDEKQLTLAVDPEDAFSDYTEITFNLPIHFGYMAPLWESSLYVGVHTGPGLTVPFYSNYSDDNNNYTETGLFDIDGFNRWNITWDIGFFFFGGGRDNGVRLDFLWSRGLTKFYSSDSSDGYRNLFSVGLHILFNP